MTTNNRLKLKAQYPADLWVIFPLQKTRTNPIAVSEVK